jgi:hypothetical protein
MGNTTQKDIAYNLFGEGATRLQVQEALKVSISTVDIAKIKSLGTITFRSLLEIKGIEEELFLMLIREENGIATEAHKRRSRHLQSIYVNFNALNIQ